MMRPKPPLVLFPFFFCIAAAHADVVVSFGSGANQFNMDFVTIGNPGNAPDTTGQPNPAGSVPYAYQIGKYEISREVIEKANAEGGLGLTLHAMDWITGGARPTMPATGVSWNEAARFVNWLNTSQGVSTAYKFSTQPGDLAYEVNANIELWQPGDAGFHAANPFRNSRAYYFLPSVDEWYKAAYYDPNANDGDGGYWDYPTGSDEPPRPVGSGAEAATAVYWQTREHGPADVMLAGGLSPYGVMGLGGNVYEWEETAALLINNDGQSVRGMRGGNWMHAGADNLNSLNRCCFLGGDFVTPDGTNDNELRTFFIGFRVASIPEPSTGLLGALGMMALLQWRRRSS